MTSGKPLPLPSFGIVPSQYDPVWYSAFVSQLARRLGLLAGPNTIQSQILLQAPNGKVYAISVDNTGTLLGTLVDRTTSHVQPPV